jgi:hypothetical protein
MTVKYEIILSEAENKALLNDVVDPVFWIDNVVRQKCRAQIDIIAKAEIERKLEAGETISGSKEDIVLAADIETAAERVARMEVEFAKLQEESQG